MLVQERNLMHRLISVSYTHLKYYASTITTLTEGSEQGYYGIEKSGNSQTYADFLVNINKRVGDFTIVANIGTSLSDNSYDMLGYNGPIQEKGIPNVFNVFDLDNTKTVSYTHLDVYKRQPLCFVSLFACTM